MKIVTEVSLKDFEFWSGAVAVRRRFTDEEMDAIEEVLDGEYEYGNSLDATDLNDLFWFDTEWLLEVLEIDEDEFWNRIPNN